ncbi:MAG: hypothetical protein M1536_07770 [Firmicutes bacterium]|nr:hypothetical protein [Bacillota bacterium]
MRSCLISAFAIILFLNLSSINWAANQPPQLVVTIRSPQSGGTGTTYTVSGFVVVNAIGAINSLLEISGHTNPGTRVFINKVALPVDNAGNFFSTYTFAPGINGVLIEASNKFGITALQLFVTYESSITSSAAVSQEDIAQLQMTREGGGLLDSVDRQTEIFVPPLALLQDTLISIVPLTSLTCFLPHL